ncbi:MAG: hypothetical protein M5R36_19320 [Deltaproteobacteria bacterium]|nr:hypothetical protein [Deltaproteobacteria bacterium]
MTNAGKGELAGYAQRLFRHREGFANPPPLKRERCVFPARCPSPRQIDESGRIARKHKTVELTQKVEFQTRPIDLPQNTVVNQQPPRFRQCAQRVDIQHRFLALARPQRAGEISLDQRVERLPFEARHLGRPRKRRG